MYSKEEIGKPDTQYGGIVTDVSQFPIGTRFFVENGFWVGEIVDMGNGEKGIQAYSYCGNKVGSPHRLYNLGNQGNIYAVSGVTYPKSQTPAKKETLSFNDGEYVIELDSLGMSPEMCYHNGKPFRDLTGDEMMYWVISELRGLWRNYKVLHSELTKLRRDHKALQDVLERRE